MPLTSFVGRETEIEEITRLAVRHRLVTLTGAGGCGKTRLALEVATQLVDLVPQRVWFADLASVAVPRMVAPSVLTAMGIKQDSSRGVETIAQALRANPGLLLLDNCEHLADECARLVEVVLRRAPAAHLIATSREPLGVPGELTWRVPPMKEAEAAQLFIERAQLADSSLELSSSQAPLVQTICRRLDAMPLALELAAGLVRSLPLAAIADGMNDRFKLPIRGPRLTSPRQQTLRATVEWSYHLLGQRERLLLNRLSVFAGSFSAHAAEEICGWGELQDALGLLVTLVEKSLVVGGAGTGDRYHLLETIRAYARERLLATPDGDTPRRHFEYYRRLAQAGGVALQSAAQIDSMHRLEQESNNFGAALDWSLTAAPEEGLAMAVSLHRFWSISGRQAEGRERLMESLAAAPAEARLTRAYALTAAGLLIVEQGQPKQAGASLEEALAICRAADDAAGEARALKGQGLAAVAEASWDAARQLFVSSLAAARRASDSHQIAQALAWLGKVSLAKAEHELARERLEEALSLNRRLGDTGELALVIDNLGHLAFEMGDFELAREHHTETLELWRKLGDPWGTAHALSNLGVVSLARGQHEAARSYFEETLGVEGLPVRQVLALEGFALLAEVRSQPARTLRLAGAAAAITGVRYGTTRSIRLRRALQRARHRVGQEAAASAWKEGSRMSPDQAVAYARSDETGREQSGLSAREREVAALVAEGLRNKEIAARLALGVRTVDSHVEHIRNKLGFQSRAQIAGWASDQGLIRPT